MGGGAGGKGKGFMEKSLTGKQRDEPDQVIGHSQLKTD